MKSPMHTVAVLLIGGALGAGVALPLAASATPGPNPDQQRPVSVQVGPADAAYYHSGTGTARSTAGMIDQCAQVMRAAQMRKARHQMMHRPMTGGSQGNASSS